jgi:hypothetical protein
MNRSKPLQRKTPLRSKTGLQRKKPLGSGKIPKRMKRRPEKRENPLKESWTRSKPVKDKSVYKWRVKTGKGMKRNKPMRKVSKKRLKVMRKNYFPANNEFLQRPENRFCYICLCRSLECTVTELRSMMSRPVKEGDRLLGLSGAIMVPAVEVHHYRGRIGRLLDFEPFFLASCRECREWPHTFFKQARALELLAPSPLYNVFPSAEELERMSLENNFEKSKKAA